MLCFGTKKRERDRNSMEEQQEDKKKKVYMQ